MMISLKILALIFVIIFGFGVVQGLGVSGKEKDTKIGKSGNLPPL